jgi:hypothetical protein
LALAGISILVLFATSSAVTAVAGRAARIEPGGKMVAVESGHWAKVAWTFSASDTADGHVCLYLVMPSLRAGGEACGLVRRSPFRVGGAYGVAFMSGHEGVSYVIGAVPATARTVKIMLSNGSVITTRTISSPAGLTSNLGFFAAERTCTAEEDAIVARDAAGLTVAKWTASPASRRRSTSDC